ncbi:MAG: type III secretion system export apparatus subunit SctT [Pseudomonadota bacterium]
MEGLFAAGDWSALALLVGLSTLRIAVAFLLLPLFTPDLVPPLVRNAIFIALAVLTLALQPVADVGAWTTAHWLRLAAKEAFLGAAIGLLFGSVLWAFEIAGQFIDLKTGASMAQVLDPLSGHQTPLTGAFLSRLAGFVFMFSGGFLLLVGLVMESYAIWPVAQPLPQFKTGGVGLLEAEFGRLMLLALLISAPFLVVLYLIEGVLGLVNRFAQQLNVFALSSSLKVLAANALLMLTLGSLVQLLIDDIAARPGVVLRTLKALVGG